MTYQAVRYFHQVDIEHKVAIPLPPGLWSPEELGAALKLWLDASDSATITITGSGISIWADKSGNSNNATQVVDADRPSIIASVQNGLDAADFDASNTEFMDLPDFASGFSASSVVIIAKADNDPPLGGGAFDAGPTIDIGNSFDSHHPFEDGVIYDSFGTNSRKTVGDPTPSLASWHLLSIRAASADYQFHVNGTSLFSTGTNTVAFTTAGKIGKSIQTGSYTYNGLIGEIIMTNSALGTSDRQKIEGYLAHKWAITSVLDAGHPYKTTPP